MGHINFLDEAYKYKSNKKSKENLILDEKMKAKKINKIVYDIREDLIRNHSTIIKDVKAKTEKRSALEDKIIGIMDKMNLNLEGTTRQDLIKLIVDEVFGYSIIQKYIEDPTVNDIMINGYNNIYVRRHLTDEKVVETFESPEDYRNFIYKICALIGKKINDSSPLVDGYDKQFNLRINITTTPINVYEPSLVIRKSHKSLDSKKVLSPENLSPEIVDTLKLFAKAGTRIIFAGPMESGKTTLMNAYLNLIDDRRIVVMEDTPEIVINSNPNVIYQQTVDAQEEDAVNVSLADLVKNFKRTNGLMPVVGEVRSVEAVELLNIFNSGFLSGVTSIHANSPNDVVNQLIFLIKSSGKLGTDREELLRYIARTVDVVIYMEKRRIISMSEIVFNERIKDVQSIELHRFNVDFEDKNILHGNYETNVNPYSPKLLQRMKRAGLLENICDDMKVNIDKIK